MEEQKKTQGEAGGDSLFDGGFDTAVPERPWATLKRLWHTAQDQHLRLLVVVLSVVCYTALAIARALTKRADLYIFDDSFSALDFQTDAALRRALRQEVAGSAVLIIAQRVSTIAHADQIIVLEDGRAVGIGRHE